MKVFLFTVFVVVLCQGKEDHDPIPKVEEYKDWMAKCTEECDISKDMEQRLADFNFKSSDEDLCIIKCGGKNYRTLQNHKFNIGLMEKIFISRGFTKPDFSDIEDVADTDPNFVDSFARWINKNKKLIIDFHKAFKSIGIAGVVEKKIID